MDTTLIETLRNYSGELYRNVVSIRKSQDLSDNVAETPEESALYQRLEMQTKHRKPDPAINRPFEDCYSQAILFPFSNKPWFATRFSDASYPAWYGSTELETTVYETVHHFRQRIIGENGMTSLGRVIQGERKVYLVDAKAKVVDLRRKCHREPRLVHPTSYAFCNLVGRAVKDAGHAGLITRSARYAAGENLVMFDKQFLSNARAHCYLTYIFDPSVSTIRVERQPGKEWMRI